MEHISVAAEEAGIPVLAVGQEKLARATISSGLAGLIKALGALLDSSVCVIDRSGRVVAEATTDRTDFIARVHEQLNRDQSRSRAFIDDSGSLTIQQLRGSGGAQVYLAV